VSPTEYPIRWVTGKGLRSLRSSLTWKSCSGGMSDDLVPKDGLHWVIRDQVIEDAEILYAA
jgi:hypothetical protein